MSTYAPSPASFVADQVELYERTGGREGNELRGRPIIILHSTGRKTGALRKTPLMRVEHDGSYAVVASQGGAPTHPLWYLNLQGHETAMLQDGPEPKTFRIREVEGEERELWWARAIETWPDYDEYVTRTERLIPVLVLEPIS